MNCLFEAEKKSDLKKEGYFLPEIYFYSTPEGLKACKTMDEIRIGTEEDSVEFGEENIGESYAKDADKLTDEEFAAAKKQEVHCHVDDCVCGRP